MGIPAPKHISNQTPDISFTYIIYTVVGLPAANQLELLMGRLSPQLLDKSRLLQVQWIPYNDKSFLIQASPLLL